MVERLVCKRKKVNTIQTMFFKKRTSPAQVLLIGTAVVLFWRGVWGLLDLYLFPSDPAVSFIVSAVLGIGILVMTHKLSDELM